MKSWKEDFQEAKHDLKMITLTIIVIGFLVWILN